MENTENNYEIEKKTNQNNEAIAPTKKIKKSTKNNRKKGFWITKTMAEQLTREDLLRATVIEMIIYFFFIFFVTIYALSLHSYSMFYLSSAMKIQFLEREFEALHGSEITFNEINSAADFWFYVEGPMFQNLFWEYYYDDEENKFKKLKDNKILYENKILGVPRIRQVKVKNDSCTIHTHFRRLFLSCFSKFSGSTEDTKSFGLGKGTAWVHNKPSKTKSLSYWGRAGSYEGGGFFQDLSNDKNKTGNIIEQLKENIWITRGTRAVFVDFSIYNANLNLFVICKIVFEYPPSGGVVPSAHFRVTNLIRFLYIIDYLVFFCQLCIYFFTLFYMFEEIREITYYKWRYFKQFWNYVDFTIICLSFITFIISLYMFLSVGPALNIIEKNPTKYGNLEYLGYLSNLNNEITAALLFFVYMKVFKYLNVNRTMGQLNNTLNKCARDIMAFSFMFFIVFIAFALLGFLLFGSQVKNFSTFGAAMFTLLRTILGDFDYAEIEEVNRILAPLFFLLYIFLVFFVLLNMFLAIINDTYGDVKTEIALAPDELQMTDFVKQNIFSFLNKLKCCKNKFKTEKKEKKGINMTIERIQETLKKCGFSDLEIEMFFSRYDIDPRSELTDDDISRFLELKSNEGRAVDPSNFVKIEDFLEQEKKLNEIENSLRNIVEKLGSLMEKLDTLDVAKKSKVNE